MMTSHSLYPTLCALKPANHKPGVIAIVGAGGKTHAVYCLARLLKEHGHSVCVTTTTKMYLPQSTVVDKLHSTTRFSDIHSHKAEITFVYKERIETRNQPQKIKGFTKLEIESLLKTDQFDYVLIEADGSKGLPLKAPARHEPCIPKQAQLVIGVTSAELLFTTAEPGRIHRWETFSQLTKCCEGDQIDEAVIERLLTSTKGLFKQAPTNAARIWLINKMDLAINRQATEALAENLFNKIPELNEIWLTELNQKEPIYKKLSR